MTTPPLPTGPGSPQDGPPAPGAFPLDPSTLPGPIRDELTAEGIEIVDAPEGPRWRRMSE